MVIFHNYVSHYQRVIFQMIYQPIPEVGTQSISPLFWAIQSGALHSARAMCLGSARKEKISGGDTLWLIYGAYMVNLC